jgi:NAD(P)-dependent dehydrogenase (short-subunit alcohol dehydrogenase family)
MRQRERHAVVTGASTGIGRATAEHLARQGYHVFATVRRSADAEALSRQSEGRIFPLIMDVTHQGQINEAVDAVVRKVGSGGLDLLVNNAGVGVFLPLELMPLERFRQQLDVNVSGQLAVTQGFLPILRQASGRIVFIGSIAGRITMPFAGAQAAAKRAVQGMAEALRQELAPWGISVVLIEPASIRTAAIDKLRRDVDTAQEDFGHAGRQLYGVSFQHMMARAQVQVRRGSCAEDVAHAVGRAALARHPRARYVVGRHGTRLALLAKLPPFALDRIRRKIFGLPAPASLHVEHS